MSFYDHVAGYLGLFFRPAMKLKNKTIATMSSSSTGNQRIGRGLLLPLWLLTYNSHHLVSGESTLQVTVPISLQKPEGYEHVDTSFSVLPYGGSIQLPLFYTNLTMCEPTLTTDLTGYPLPSTTSDGQPLWKSPFIIMVDPYGDCSYQTKIRNSQGAGAAGILLTSVLCRCEDENCVPDAPTDNCTAPISFIGEETVPVDITIPAFLVFKQGADPIKKALVEDAQIVQVEMAYALPDPKTRVDFSLWTLPRDPHSKDFLISFLDAEFALGPSVNFTPHVAIQDGRSLGCVGNASACSPTMCTNQGRYCATPSGRVTGADLVQEGLRRLCIWKEYGGDGVGASWWLYLYLFLQKCEDDDALFADPVCVNNSYGPLIDAALVEDCMDQAGGLTGDQNNELLDLEIQAQQDQRITILPSLTVERKIVPGSLTFGGVFQTLCKAFDRGYEPDICQECASCGDVRGCVQGYGACPTSSSSSSSSGPSPAIWTVTSAMGLAFLVVVVVVWVMHKRQRRLIRQTVREQVSALHAPLEMDTEGGSTAPEGSEAASHTSRKSNDAVPWASASPVFT